MHIVAGSGQRLRLGKKSPWESYDYTRQKCLKLLGASIVRFQPEPRVSNDWDPLPWFSQLNHEGTATTWTAWRSLFPFLSSLRIDLTQLNHWHIHYPSVPNMQMQYSSTSLTALWTLKVNLFVFVLFFQFEYTGHLLCCQYKHLVYVKDLKKFGSWLVYC